MNKTTMEMLEFNKIKEILKGFANSEQGKMRIENLEPSLNLDTINHWQKETTEAKEIIKKSSSIPLHHLNGIDKVVDKLNKGMTLQPTEFTNLFGFLKDGAKLKQFMKGKEIFAPLVSSYAYSIFELDHLVEEIERSIHHDQVDDKATPQLAKIRRKIATVEDKIKSKLDSILNSSSNTDYIQENIVSKRGGRYVIPVKRTHKGNIDGNVLDTSSSGATIFVEPKAIGKLQDELNILILEEEKEVYQILTYLTGLVEASKKEISINIETMVHYDFIFAKAKYSKAIDGNPVEMNNNKYIDIKGGKHPLIGQTAVPLDFIIGKDYTSLVITGPNTGGKTVSLKTVGLMTLMVESGLHVPVEEGSSFSIFKDILVDIGDGQSIEQNLSTFSSHIRNIISIMEAADDSSLVILDELGAGTDPGEGMGLAIAILENIYQKKAITIATTHYSEIKDFANLSKGFENGSMEFDIETLKPTYKLHIGKSGESNAFLIALKLGMNKGIVERAHQITYKEDKVYNDEMLKALVKKVHNEEILQSHKKNEVEIAKTTNITKKKKKKEHKKESFKIGDSVFISSLQTTGIVCELENGKGEVGVMVKKKKLKINRKRLTLHIDGKELYPEDYDLDIVFESKENRKKKNLMKRKYVKDLSIEYKD